MHFQPDQLYHIYNQGNNKQQIFFTRDNYVFFLQKLQKHLTPVCSILAWCLMPNHFHLMVKVFNLSCSTYSPGDYNQDAHSHPVSKKDIHPVSKNIATILRSYTRAINKQENRSGSLFRGNTKGVCITCSDGIAQNWFSSNEMTKINIEVPERQYPQVCYGYILNNPVVAGLVKQPQDWEFSSARDVMGLRDGKLIDREVIKEYGLAFSA